MTVATRKRTDQVSKRRRVVPRIAVTGQPKRRKGRCPKCSKVTYVTEIDALLALGDMGNAGKSMGHARAYFCERVGGWHLTSQARYGGRA